ncbi:hypothetical protein JCM10213_000763 [Rhodosporidiobolus nylandii]
MNPPPGRTARPRPYSVYDAPPSPSSHAGSAGGFTFGAPSSRPTSPPPASPTASPRLNRRPTHQAHRTTSSLSSLAQLNLNGSGYGSYSAAGGGGSARSGSPSPRQSPDLGGRTLERTNSILASPSTHWGGFVAHGNGGGGTGREYEDVQNRTFCKWLNARLEPNGFPPVDDVGRDFSDGTRLIQLVSVLTQEPAKRFNHAPNLRVQKMENANQALAKIKEMGVHLTNIGPEDIVDGNRKLILGMIWSLVLRFAIADISEEGSHAKEGLLLWCQRRTAPYEEVDVKDFTRSWQDGLAFCALIHRHRPDLLDYNSLPKDQLHDSAASNLALAFKVAEEHLGIPQLLDVEDVCGTRRPDERSIMTYVAQFFHAFSSRAQAETEARVISNFVDNVNSLMLAIHDYERRVTDLLHSLHAQTESLSASLPPSTPYATLFALRAAAADFRAPGGKRREWAKEKLDTAELLANVREKLKTYGLRGYSPPTGLRVVDVQEKWDDMCEAEATRNQEINMLIRQIQREARERFAAQANKLQRELQDVAGELSALSGPLDTQLALLTHLRSTRLAPLRPALALVEEAETDCRECEAFADGVDETAVIAAEELEWELEAIERKVDARRAFVENQIVARKQTNVTPEQLEEFESAFRAFDKDGKNLLDLDELAGALGSLGISAVDLDDITQVDDHVSFEEFLRFMTARAEDRLTGEKVRSCFRSVAAEKGYITELDLSRLALPSSALAFLKEQMPSSVLTSEVEGGRATDGAETVFDYEQFLAQFLEDAGAR